MAITRGREARPGPISCAGTALAKKMPSYSPRLAAPRKASTRSRYTSTRRGETAVHSCPYRAQSSRSFPSFPGTRVTAIFIRQGINPAGYDGICSGFFISPRALPLT